MSKERARRRAARLAEVQARRAAAERRARRRAMLRRLRPPLPRRRRTGRLYARRTRAERASIAVGGLVVLGLIWYVLDLSLTVRIAITALLLLALPAVVVITFDRRY